MRVLSLCNAIILLPGEAGKPADIFIPRHAGGKDAALDVTVINTLQAATVAQAAQTPGYALTVAHKRKMDKSGQLCHQQGIVFLPLAVESLGAWHKSAIAEVKKLGSSLVPVFLSQCYYHLQTSRDAYMLLFLSAGSSDPLVMRICYMNRSTTLSKNSVGIIDTPGIRVFQPPAKTLAEKYKKWLHHSMQILSCRCYVLAGGKPRRPDLHFSTSTSASFFFRFVNKETRI